MKYFHRIRFLIKLHSYFLDIEKMPITLRFKRRDVTVFLTVEPADSIRKLKQAVAAATGMPAANLRLYLGLTKDFYLEEETIVSDHLGIKDGSVIAFTAGEEPIAAVELSMSIPSAAAAVPRGGAAGGAGRP